jgi:aryl-alcohol dehydrogenase-like predicted oxidoreductase
MVLSGLRSLARKRSRGMKYTTFGKTGLKVSRIALGGMPFGAQNLARGWDPYSEAGQKTILETIDTGLELGINYIDTAPSYGYGAKDNFGHSERMYGMALEGRRDAVHVATKVGHNLKSTKDDTKESVEQSLTRLRTDYVDVIQFHGGFYTPEQCDHILNAGPLEGLLELRDQGKARFLGFTAEQGDSALALIESDMFDMMQVRYNFIYQGISPRAIELATEKGMGITVMRPMASSQMHLILEHLEPRWIEKGADYAVCLKFVLADSRIHMANVGMRWPDEVRQNVELVNGFEPTLDIAAMPRSMLGMYRYRDGV